MQRATLDLDFILALEDLEAADAILQTLGFSRHFHSENVSHYRRDDQSWRVNLLHAFRSPALAMLGRAERLPIDSDTEIPIAATEDIIGLKVQELNNDPDRADQDWLDIKMLVRSAHELNLSLNWELIEQYFALFDKADLLSELQKNR